jgi:hypothetical protein
MESSQLTPRRTLTLCACAAAVTSFALPAAASVAREPNQVQDWHYILSLESQKGHRGKTIAHADGKVEYQAEPGKPDCFRARTSGHVAVTGDLPHAVTPQAVVYLEWKRCKGDKSVLGTILTGGSYPVPPGTSTLAVGEDTNANGKTRKYSKGWVSDVRGATVVLCVKDEGDLSPRKCSRAAPGNAMNGGVVFLEPKSGGHG